MKSLKNILIAGLLAASVLSASAANKTVLIPATGFTNLLNALPNGGAQISQFIVSSMTTNTARVLVYDTATNTMVYTSPAYIQLTSYATNKITTWTNYYGTTNSFTNVALVQVTNTVTATTNFLPMVFQGTSPTNTATTYDGLYNFRNGVWATNASAVGSIQVTITYEQ